MLLGGSGYIKRRCRQRFCRGERDNGVADSAKSSAEGFAQSSVKVCEPNAHVQVSKTGDAVLADAAGHNA